MENIIIQLSPPLNADVVFKYPIPMSTLQDMFCFNLNNYTPKPANIHNDKIDLFTFISNDCKQVCINIAKLKTPQINQQISTEFLTYVSKLKYKNENYKKNIPNHDDIKMFIDESCKEKVQEDMKWLKNNAKITPSSNDKYNITCGKILSNLFEQVPGRFDKNNKITPIQFRKNDKIIYNCILTAGNIKRVYAVQLYVV